MFMTAPYEDLEINKIVDNSSQKLHSKDVNSLSNPK